MAYLPNNVQKGSLESPQPTVARSNSNVTANNAAIARAVRPSQWQRFLSLLTSYQSKNLSWMARRAFSESALSISTEILISEVEIIWMLMRL